jgi:hypothetical protein
MAAPIKTLTTTLVSAVPSNLAVVLGILSIAG